MALFRSPIVNQVGHTTLRVALPTFGFSSPMASPGRVRRCEASSCEAGMYPSTRFRVCASREDYHPRARSPFTDSPVDVGNALLWTVAAYRFLQTRFEVRAHLRVPSSSPASECKTSHEVVFLLRLQRVSPKKRALRSEPNRFYRRRKPSIASSNYLLATRNLSGSTEVSEGLVHCECPSSFPCRAPLCHQPAAAKNLECLPPRLAS